VKTFALSALIALTTTSTLARRQSTANTTLSAIPRPGSAGWSTRGRPLLRTWSALDPCQELGRCRERHERLQGLRVGRTRQLRFEPAVRLAAIA
jgi:hypothetical protein